MKRSDSLILLILPLVALVVAFWLLVLAPKRQEASKLGDEVSKLRSEVEEQKQLTSAATEAKAQFPDNYEKVVELGRAVPQDDDTATLFAEFSKLSGRVGVDFRAIALDATQSGSAPPPVPTTNESSGESGQSGDSAGATPTSTPEAATEATAANLPIGATVGPAGFPVMPYKLEFAGDFFRVADFIHQLDSMVSTRANLVSVRGRLLTIDGFTLMQNSRRGFPALTAKFTVTTYLTPADQGILGGATPQGPPESPPLQQVAAGASTAPASVPTSTGG